MTALAGFVMLGFALLAADVFGRWALTLDPDFSGNPETLYSPRGPIGAARPCSGSRA